MGRQILRAKQVFNPAGVEYLPDAVIEVADVASWPDGSLQRRLENGFCVYDVLGDEAAPAVVDEPAVEAKKGKKATE